MRKIYGHHSVCGRAPVYRMMLRYGEIPFIVPR